MKTWQMRLSPNRSAKSTSAVGAGLRIKMLDSGELSDLSSLIQYKRLSGRVCGSLVFFTYPA